MSILKFILSKVFLRQLILALVTLVILCFLTLKWLKYTTNHGSFIEVPNLKGKTIEVAKIELNDTDLRMEIQDSANFNPKYPKFSVIEQYPLAGTKVKESRKIYLILNPSGYRKAMVPQIVRRTFRQAKPTLEALGFKVGEITYKDDIGKDEVLAITHNGAPINAGDKLAITSQIDLVLGNGKRKTQEVEVTQDSL